MIQEPDRVKKLAAKELTPTFEFGTPPRAITIVGKGHEKDYTDGQLVAIA